MDIIGPRVPTIRVFDCHIARQTDQGIEFLLLLRSDAKIYAGTWRMVGGKLKDDETAWQAALREVKEETSLDVRSLFTVPYVNRFYEWRHDRINDIPVFVALVGDGDPVLDDEHTDFAWLSASKAVEKLSWPGQREGLMAALNLLETKSPLHSFLKVAF